MWNFIGYNLWGLSPGAAPYPPTKTPLLRPYPLLERLVGPKGGPLRQSVMLSGNIVNIVRGPGILVLYRGTVGTASLLRSIYALALNKYWTLPRARPAKACRAS